MDKTELPITEDEVKAENLVRQEGYSLLEARIYVLLEKAKNHQTKIDRLKRDNSRFSVALSQCGQQLRRVMERSVVLKSRITALEDVVDKARIVNGRLQGITHSLDSAMMEAKNSLGNALTELDKEKKND